jgi:RNA polymerase sigma-70 factor (ECF subfamily)
MHQTPNDSAAPDGVPSLDDLFVQCYAEFRAIASRALSGERPGHTLQTTDLVHDIYARLRKTRSIHLNDKVHFVRLASRAMRRHLFDAARKRQAVANGGHLVRVTLVTAEDAGHEPFQPEVIALGMSMERLESLHERQAWVIDMRFIGGLTVDETATELGVSPKTVKEDTRAALAFLRREASRRIGRP